MKQIFITLVLALTILGLQAQTTTYYKSSRFKKVVPVNKAKYKIVRYTKKDTTVYKSYEIKGNQLLTVIKTLNGHATGIWYKYDNFGDLIYRKDFRELVYSDTPVNCPFLLKKDDPRWKLVKTAQFPGGIPGLMAFLKSHIHYSEVSKEMQDAGTVIIRFVINEDGTPIPNSIKKGVDPFLDLAAWNVIKEMPAWTPAHLEGKPIRTLFNLPVKFSLR
ncbi:MAG: TonB family protein [Bacteroidales bacterium]|nr:TonB family protein [Bacteroidales bacterium]